jgi:chorismate dehydratase
MDRSVIGCVPYLNAKPIIAWFHTPAGEEAAEVRYEVPSLLAELLERREITTGLLSSFEIFKRPDAVVVPGVSISSSGPVKSVRLFSKVPFEQINRVALDQSSLTSNALAQIVLPELYGVQAYYEPRPPQLEAMLTEFDAGLLIGDPGMSTLGEGLHILDLGEAWLKLTGLPFVWAVWLANEEQITRPLIQALQEARAYGESRMEIIAQHESNRLNWPELVCQEYLCEIMNYALEENHLSALETFQHLCKKHSLIEEANLIRPANP